MELEQVNSRLRNVNEGLENKFKFLQETSDAKIAMLLEENRKVTKTYLVILFFRTSYVFNIGVRRRQLQSAERVAAVKVSSRFDGN